MLMPCPSFFSWRQTCVTLSAIELECGQSMESVRFFHLYQNRDTLTILLNRCVWKRYAVQNCLGSRETSGKPDARVVFECFDMICSSLGDMLLYTLFFRVQNKVADVIHLIIMEFYVKTVLVFFSDAFPNHISC